MRRCFSNPSPCYFHLQPMPVSTLSFSQGTRPTPQWMRRSPRCGLNTRGSPPFRVLNSTMFNVVTFPSLRVTLINFPSLRGGQVGHRGDCRYFDSPPLGGPWGHFSHFFRILSLLGTSWALLGRFLRDFMRCLAIFSDF